MYGVTLWGKHTLTCRVDGYRTSADDAIADIPDSVARMASSMVNRRMMRRLVRG